MASASIEAVVDRVVEINRQPGRRRGELTNGEEDAYRCRSQCIGSIGKIVRADFIATTYGPLRIADLGKEEFRSDERGFGIKQARCLVRSLLLHKPFHNDVGIDHIAIQVTLSRSLSARMISLLSMENVGRFRNSLAREAKSCSPSRNTLRRMSLCSASAERPWGEALIFSERMICRDTIRTVGWGMMFACNEAHSMLSIMDPFS